MARSDPTAWVIEPLEGGAGGEARTPIVLEGRELPFRAGMGGSISYGITQRSKLGWYQGNPVASQQIMGPTLKPTTINGVWQERYLGVDRPINLVETMERLVASGTQVRVSWETVVRIGIAKDFTWKPGDPTGGLTDIAWELVFEWISDSGKTITTVFGTREVSLRPRMADTVSAVGATSDEIRSLLDSMSVSREGSDVLPFQGIKAALEQFFVAIDQPQRTMTSVGMRASDIAILPPRLARAGDAAAADAIQRLGAVQDVVADIFTGLSTVLDDLVLIIEDRIQKADVVEAAFRALESAFDTRVFLAALLRPATFRLVPALVGGDLRLLASQFYGNPDLWTRIAQLNGIPTSEIPEGFSQIVIAVSLPTALDDGADVYR